MSLLGSSQGIRLAPLSSERARAVSLMNDIGSSGFVILLFNMPVYFWIWMSPDSLRMGGQEKERGEERVIRELCCSSFSHVSIFVREKTPRYEHSPLPSWVTLEPSVPQERPKRIEQLTSLGSSLFSLPLWIFHPYLAAWLFGIPKVMSVLSNWESWHFELGSCWWVAMWAQGAWSPKSFLFPFVWFSSVLFFPASATPPGTGCPFCVLCTAISHNWEISALQKANNGIHTPKDFLLQMSRCPFKNE